MAYVTIPKDLSQIKTKVAFGLTKRQLICFGLGALVGAPFFFLSRGVLGTSAATLGMIFLMMPFLFLFNNWFYFIIRNVDRTGSRHQLFLFVRTDCPLSILNYTSIYCKSLSQP